MNQELDSQEQARDPGREKQVPYRKVQIDNLRHSERKSCRRSPSWSNSCRTSSRRKRYRHFLPRMCRRLLESPWDDRAWAHDLLSVAGLR